MEISDCEQQQMLYVMCDGDESSQFLWWPPEDVVSQSRLIAFTCYLTVVYLKHCIHDYPSLSLQNSFLVLVTF